MSRLTITLPKSLATFVEEQSARDGYESPDAFVAALIREVQQSVADDEVEAKLLEGLESGPATPMTRDDWDVIRDEVHRRHAARTSQRARNG
jgi:antitoxin ParD1/3/4